MLSCYFAYSHPKLIVISPIANSLHRVISLCLSCCTKILPFLYLYLIYIFMFVILVSIWSVLVITCYYTLLIGVSNVDGLNYSDFPKEDEKYTNIPSKSKSSFYQNFFIFCFIFFLILNLCSSSFFLT